MEKMFGPAYGGDPGIPHSGKDGFTNIFWGCVTASAYSFFCPYFWEQCCNHYNWHDLAMMCENHRFKRAIEKNERYKPVWNKVMPRRVRDAYYHNWADYFP